jgi:hypothetical protein
LFDDQNIFCKEDKDLEAEKLKEFLKAKCQIVLDLKNYV